MSEVIKKVPAVGSQLTSRNENQSQHKDTTSLLPRQLKRVLSYLLQASSPRSVVDVMRDLGLSDPRGHISRLRRRGYPIGDVWHTTSEGNRFKCYFVRKEGINE
jgi:hypothetical protein